MYIGNRYEGVRQRYQGIGDSKELVLGARKENLLDEPFTFISEIAFHFDGFDGVTVISPSS